MVLPLALLGGAASAPLVPFATGAGGAAVGIGLALGGSSARLLIGIGVGWAATGLHDRAAVRALTENVDVERPVVVRGRLSADRGRDAWGRYQSTLRVRTVRQGEAVAAMRLRLEVRSPDRLAPGSVRVKGFIDPGRDRRLRMSIKDIRLVKAEPRSGWSSARLGKMRQGMVDYADRRLSTLVDAPRELELLRSLVFGRSRELDPRLQSAFRRLGLGHLFAVSGLHIGILAGVAWVLVGLRPGLTPVWVRRLAVVALVLAYGWILGPRGSVARAATIVVLWHGVELLGRRLDPIPALTTCVAGLMLIDPHWWSDLGLQLSVLAVLGILIVGVPAAATLTPRIGWSGGLLGIGLGAQLATVPLAAATFHWLAPLAPLYGLLAIPWAAAVLCLAVVAVLLPLPAAPLASIGWLIERLLSAGTWLAALSPHRIDGWPVTPVGGLLYAGGMMLCLLPLTTPRSLLKNSHARRVQGLRCGCKARGGVDAVPSSTTSNAADVPQPLCAQRVAGGVRPSGALPLLDDGSASPASRRLPSGRTAPATPRMRVLQQAPNRRRWLRWGSPLVGLMLMLWVVIPRSPPPPRLVMLDVGQGDSLLLQAGGRNLLVDGGGDARRLLGHFAAYRVRSLDVLVVSHPDRDHCAGGRDLAGWIQVREVWTASGWDHDCHRDLLALPGTRLRPLWAGRRRRWQDFDFQVLAPAPAGTRVDNDDSLVLRLTAGSKSRVLLTGDIEFRGERKLLRRAPCPMLSVEVLKVAHHGSRSSTGRPLLDCVKPKLALVSAGADNVFGHPAPEVLHRLDEAEVRVLRTDLRGSIELSLE